MKFSTITLLVLFVINGFSQSTSVLEEQMLLKFDKVFISHIKTENPEKYNFHIAELKSSFEFVELRPDLKYRDLVAYDFKNKQEKELVFLSEEKFSLYDYKFIRHKSLDITYRIPGTDKGILVYSKEKFTSKL